MTNRYIKLNSYKYFLHMNLHFFILMLFQNEIRIFYKLSHCLRNYFKDKSKIYKHILSLIYAKNLNIVLVSHYKNLLNHLHNNLHRK